MGIVIAWGAGLGIITYRWVRAGAPPTPGTLAMASGFFALCALLAEYPPARTTATLLAFGVDLAAYLQVVGKVPAQQATGWPPPLITDPNVLLPTGSGTAAASSSGSSSSGSSSSGSSSSRGRQWNPWTGYL